jgi:predicted nucleic acid-binding protein
VISSFGVVLDASALVPASLCDALLSAADHRLDRPMWSDAILDEMERNVARLFQQYGTSAHDAIYIASYRRGEMIKSYPEAAITGYESLIGAMENDVKDRHVLAAAIRASAQVIVTADARGFPDSALGPFGIVAQTPDEFLKDLLGFDSSTMLDVIRNMAAAKSKPPMTELELLRRLGKCAPDFAASALIMLEEDDARTARQRG